MEAIYFGSATWHKNHGAGHGPWVGADLEAGMYYGGGAQTVRNNQSTPLTSDFVSLHLKGRTDGFALKGGDATQGGLKTMFDGLRCVQQFSVSKTCHRFLSLYTVSNKLCVSQ